MMEFPSGFFWGAATSSYQVEGNNSNADWWHWELSRKNVTPSASACRHYELFKEDFKLAKSLNHNCHRLSLEWSRIQPSADSFSEEALRHYREELSFLRSLGIEPVVTIHHFTNPLWFARSGGWKQRKAPVYFLAYTRKVLEALSDLVTYWVTINEPMVYVYHSYLSGLWPPQEKTVLGAKKAMDNMAEAHMRAYCLIHDFYAQKHASAPQVSIAHNMVSFVPCTDAFRDRMFSRFRHWSFNYRFLDVLCKRKTLDYIGVNYYTRHLIDTRAWSFDELVNNLCANGHNTLPKNSLGWEIYPKGIYDVLIGLKKYQLPVFVLENGICTDDDSQRWEYIRSHVQNVQHAMNAGIDVIGYLYWSLLDNFEWDKGFAPRFGLCDVDYTTFVRTPRESAKKFASLCATGRLAE